MSWEAWFTVGVVVLVLAGLATNRFGADLVVGAGAALLLIVGVLTPAQALEGAANEAIATIAALYVVVCGLVRTGAVARLSAGLLGDASTAPGALMRLLPPVAALSAFINNTPLVAMFIPALDDWRRRRGIAASKVMLPLSYAAILGGTCSLVGTSTNLVVAGEWTETGRPPLGFFEIAWVGVPAAIVGLLYILTVGQRILPSRQPPLSLSDDPRSYTVEMVVDPAGPLAGKTIEQAGLRHLPSLYLAEIERNGELIAAVGPEQRLIAGDRLVFVGVVDAVVDLQRIHGLVPATEHSASLSEPRRNRTLIEAVVSNSCPLIGRTIREGGFRSVYNAVVIAVARNGERINRKIGDITLRAGDTLLLEAPRSFVEQQRNSRDFFLLSEASNSTPPRHERAPVALGILALLIAIATLRPFGMGMLHAAAIAAGLTILTRCCTGPEARRSVEWQVLIVIAASLAIGRAMEVTGAAGVIAGGLVALGGGSPFITLALVYLATTVFTEVITNNAAAVLIFPIAAGAAEALGADFKPFAICIMMAASASFATPIGYQTNLMVQSPGGYTFADYLRVGVPLNLLMFVVTTPLAALIWPLHPAP